MEIKGIGVITTREFLRTRHKSSYQEWIDQLPATSRDFYISNVVMEKWYPMKEAYLDPLDQIIDRYYNGNVNAALEIGKFSADYVLNGIYKAFLLVTTPWFLMKKASRMLSSFYMPCEIDVQKMGNTSVEMNIRHLPGITKALEYRIIGWCMRALELCGCRDIQFELLLSLPNNNALTKIRFSWQ